MDDKSYYDEFSDGNEKHVVETREKADPCYKVTKNLYCVHVLGFYGR